MRSHFRALIAVLLFGMPVLPAWAVNQQVPDMQNAKAWIDKGMLMREAGNQGSTEAFIKAAEHLDKAIAAEKDIQILVRAYTLRARCRNLLGNNDEAIQDLTKAIELAPQDGDIYYMRSFIHEAMGHARLSLDDLKTAARKNNEKAQGELKAKNILW